MNAIPAPAKKQDEIYIVITEPVAEGNRYHVQAMLSAAHDSAHAACSMKTSHPHLEMTSQHGHHVWPSTHGHAVAETYGDALAKAHLMAGRLNQQGWPGETQTHIGIEYQGATVATCHLRTGRYENAADAATGSEPVPSKKPWHGGEMGDKLVHLAKHFREDLNSSSLSVMLFCLIAGYIAAAVATDAVRLMSAIFDLFVR